MADNITVNPSTYSIYDKILNGIGSKYLDIENNDILKAGELGYMTEVMAMIARDGIIHRNLMYNESFLNTASIPKSIYNWAKMFQVDVNKARPAVMPISITMKKSDIIKYATDTIDSRYGDSNENDNKSYFIIDRETPFYVEKTPFSLERSIIILVEPGLLKENITVQYSIVENNYTDYDETISDDTPYVKSMTITGRDGEEYITMLTNVYQYERISEDRYVTSKNYIDNKIHTFTHPDQLAYVNVYYTDRSGNTSFIPIISNSDLEKDDDRFCYFTKTDNNKFEISFSGYVNDFMPQSNTILNVEYFVTKGSEGNFDYDGSIVYKFEDENIRNVPISVSKVRPSGGGLDEPDLLSVKKKIMDAIATRETIITESDLNSYFNSLQYAGETTNTDYKFVKKQDDVLRRIFSVYLLLRDSNDTIVPTNTINAKITSPSISASNRLSKKPGSLIVYTSSSFDDELNNIVRQYEFTEDINDVDSILKSYICPYYMLVSTEPVPMVKYIHNSVSDSVGINYTNVSTSFAKEIVPSSINIYRNSIGSSSDTYYLTLSMSSNLTDDELNNLVIRWIIGDDEFESKIVSDISYSSVSGSEQELVLTVDPTDEFDGSGEYINVKPSDASGYDKLKEDINIKIDFYYDGNLVVSTEADNSVKLFNSLEDIMTSDLKITYNTVGDPSSGISSMNILDVPVILGEYYTRTSGFQDVVETINSNADILNGNLGRLENNTTFDMKFYNTSGLSYLHSSSTTNIRLSLSITSKTVLTTEDQSNIKEFIYDFIENSNEDRVISISLLMTDLQLAFYDLIKYIEFRGLNDTFDQTILYLKSQEQNISIPEYINISELDIIWN
jgi:hypothetical protein